MKIKIVAILLTFSVLSGCTIYQTKFACGSAKGVSCSAMDRIDRMIESRAIDYVTEEKDAAEKPLPEINTHNQDIVLYDFEQGGK